MALRIETTQDSSFCPGVDRAFRITEETMEAHQAYSLGPLIHNPAVVSRLSLLGLRPIDLDCEDLPDLDGVHVVIRSHGIDTETEERLRALGAVLVDATCPTVKRAQEAARELAEQGFEVLVLGSATHPEVRSIVGRAGAPVTVIESVEEAESWLERAPAGGRVGVVCQTTTSRDLLHAVVPALKERMREVAIKDTICHSVTRRREEALELSGRVELMVVVGGRDSSNTARLAEVCAQTGVETMQIEGPEEIDPARLEGIESVGVTGGASTPSWLIEETVARIREMGSGRKA